VRGEKAEATTSARGPFTGVLGFVHANVICRGLRKINVRVAPGRNEEPGWRNSPVHLHVCGV
jgi:hypothetical protein